MKELEHVLQRVRIRGQDGLERKLKESIYAVLRVLADATDKNAPERGCQMSIPELCKRSRKERSTVMEALAGARRLKLLTRHAPGAGARYATHLNLIDIRLVEASQKSRPFLGPVLVYDEPATTSEKPHTNATLKAKTMQKTQQKCGLQVVLDVQNLDVQILDGEHVLNTPPPPGSVLTLVEGVHVDSLTLTPPPLSSCPSRAGGCGSGFQLLEDSTFKELQEFSDFLEKNQVSALTTFCQRRRKNDGKRGGVFWEAKPKNYTELLFQVQRAADAGFEITMQSDQLIMLDDLDKKATTELIRSCFELVVVETSIDNFQVLLAAGPGWTTNQIRSTQRALAARFGGDGNATAARQLHRLPGSLNRKNGECFVTRLHVVQHGEFVEPVYIDPVQAVMVVVPDLVRAQHRSLTGKDITPSGQDFGRACELVARGADHAAIVVEIAGRAASRRRHSNHAAYAKRTADNAFLRLQR